jgi:hypothetical protein
VSQITKTMRELATALEHADAMAVDGITRFAIPVSAAALDVYERWLTPMIRYTIPDMPKPNLCYKGGCFYTKAGS